jgi:magnesium-transporting ATPase (P-type)
VFAELMSSLDELSSAEAEKWLEQYSPNALKEKTRSPLVIFLGYFWRPIPWMIEVAAVLSVIVGHWMDLIKEERRGQIYVLLLLTCNEQHVDLTPFDVDLTPFDL